MIGRCSLFAQVLRRISRRDFAAAVRCHGAGKGAKGFSSKLNWSLSNLAALLRLNLMTHRDLDAWINGPYAYLRVGPPEPELPLFANMLDSIAGGQEIETGLSGG